MTTPQPTTARTTEPTTAPTTARTLADTLRGWSDAALAALVEARPDVARPTPADISQLAARVAGRGSVTMAVDRLDTAHLSVIEALALLPDPAAASDVQRLVHASPTTVDAVLDRLLALALVWGDGADLRLVRPAREVLGPTPGGLGPSLMSLLSASRPGLVADLATDLGLETSGDPVATAGRVAAAYGDPTWAQARVDAATDAGGEDVERLLERLAPGPPTGRLDVVPAGARLDTAANALEHLLARGLLVAVDDHTVVLPREIGLHLRGGCTTTAPVDVAPAPTTRPVDRSLVDRTGAGAAFETVRSVQLVLEAWGVKPPAVLRSGGVGVRDVRAVAAELDTSIEEAGFLLELARAAGLLTAGDDAELDEVWLPTDDFDRWRELPTAQRWAHLAGAWLDTARATVLIGERDARGRPVNPLGPDLERRGAAACRRAALAVVADANPGQSVDDAEQVVAAVAWRRPRRAVLRDALTRRSLVEAARLGLTASGAITPPGRALLAGAGAGAGAGAAARLLEPLLPEPVDHVLLQGDLTAVAPGPLDPQVAHGLALVADIESRGGATVYRFSADSVRRALDAGWPASQVHAFIEAHSRTPVPQALSYLVDDTARRHGQLRVGTASVYVRTDDPTELDTLLADSELAPLGLRRTAPTVALSDLPADVVLSRLRRAHRAPVLETADGHAVGVTSDSHRARAERVRHDPPVDVHRMDAAQAATAVGAMRAGERARTARPGGATTPGPARLIDELRAAAGEGSTVWLAYLDDAGTVSERVVEPLRVDDGRLTAYDHRSATRRSFSLHRISRVAAVG